MNRVESIEHEIFGLRKVLTNHQLYYLLADIDDIRIFMEKHVFAVWDFMSLLKALQNHLTSVRIPWKPVKNAKTARFINEIVWGEESDVNEHGIPKSHFEMYLEAMQEVNADTDRVLNLVNAVSNLEDINGQLANAGLSEAEEAFLAFTFNTIRTGETHKIAAAFTFGREDLIPDMFIEIIKQANKNGENRFPKLTYYLERHIEVDGDEHGPLSLEMISELCGEDDQKWAEVTATAKSALKQRIKLWDDIAEAIQKKQLAYQEESVLIG